MALHFPTPSKKFASSQGTFIKILARLPVRLIPTTRESVGAPARRIAGFDPLIVVVGDEFALGVARVCAVEIGAAGSLAGGFHDTADGGVAAAAGGWGGDGEDGSHDGST
jgi:hypothetical protein